ncbi:regulatory protein GemA [Salmonella enterica]|nr:regulatory protein GemA [Salmonella enterica]
MTPNAKRLIGVVKMGQTHLGWDDDTYRAVLARLTGKTSARLCSLEELVRVRDYMHDSGFPRPTNHGRRPNPARTKTGVLSKIEAILADAGRPWDYAESMARRMFSRQAIEWLTYDELTCLMQALIIDQKRRQKREAANG